MGRLLWSTAMMARYEAGMSFMGGCHVDGVFVLCLYGVMYLIWVYIVWETWRDLERVGFLFNGKIKYDLPEKLISYRFSYC